MDDTGVSLRVKVSHPGVSLIEEILHEKMIEGFKYYINNSFGYKFKTKIPSYKTNLLNEHFLNNEADTLEKDIYNYFKNQLGDIKIDYYTFEEKNRIMSVDVEVKIEYSEGGIKRHLEESKWKDLQNDKEFKDILKKYIPNIIKGDLI